MKDKIEEAIDQLVRNKIVENTDNSKIVINDYKEREAFDTVLDNMFTSDEEVMIVVRGTKNLVLVVDDEMYPVGGEVCKIYWDPLTKKGILKPTYDPEDNPVEISKDEFESANHLKDFIISSFDKAKRE